MSPFADLLKTYRERANLAQMHLALLVSADHSYVSRLESGTRSPSQPMAEALADRLNLSPREHDAFLAAAGFASRHLIQAANDPDLAAVADVLLDSEVPDWYVRMIREQLRLLATLAHDARQEAAA